MPNRTRLLWKFLIITHDCQCAIENIWWKLPHKNFYTGDEYISLLRVLFYILWICVIYNSSTYVTDGAEICCRSVIKRYLQVQTAVCRMRAYINYKLFIPVSTVRWDCFIFAPCHLCLTRDLKNGWWSSWKFVVTLLGIVNNGFHSNVLLLEERMRQFIGNYRLKKT